MKKTSLIALCTFFLAYGNASAFSPYHYANAFSANNIIAIQHSIMANAMQTFEGTAAAALGGRAKLFGDANRYMYGMPPMYGRPHLYGEYGDDGTAQKSVQGRNGGDDTTANANTERTDPRPIVNSIWLNWQHIDDDVKFRGYDELDTNTDIISIGLAGGEAQWGIGISEWGIFGGYIGGDQENEFVNISENGGYIGLYTGYNIKNFNLSFAGTAGALFNGAEHEYGTDEYANTWAGVAMNATFNLELDDSFTIQPGVYAGYTWIGSANYASMAGALVENHNFNTFEVAPEIRAIKHLGSGWFGFINFKYAFMFGGAGDTTVNGIGYEELETRDYAEYGLGIEKSIDRFNVSLNINRRDGGRTGWNGGFNLKYIF